MTNNLNHLNKTFNEISPVVVPQKLAVIGDGILKNNALLANILQADIQRWSFLANFQQEKPQAFIGWGQKKSYYLAKKIAKKLSVPILSIEDGFLRSLDSGVDSYYAVSVVVDDIGIYFDLTQPSRLEQLIMMGYQYWADTKCQQANQLINLIIHHKLSKYNSTLYCPKLDDVIASQTNQKLANKEHILVIDQVKGDLSIQGAGANHRQFKKMLAIAQKNHPNAYIWIKSHPAGKVGYLTKKALPKNVQILTDKVNPIALLQQVSHVYTVSSHMGFEALMMGKAVHCFGVNWYSGWGLTNDKYVPQKLLNKVQKRRQQFAKQANIHINSMSVAQLFYTAYIEYSRYIDPASRKVCEIETAIFWLMTNRSWQQRLMEKTGNQKNRQPFSEQTLNFYSLSAWKQSFIPKFLGFPHLQLKHQTKFALLRQSFFDKNRHQSQKFAVWGLKGKQELQSCLKHQPDNIDIFCIEDGFIRSNGLGATLLAPLSIAVDGQGIYYDATCPSDLEYLLKNCKPLSDKMTKRVIGLKHKLLEQRISKYNVGKASEQGLIQLKKLAKGRKIILIVGQVESDLSIKYCGSKIKRNADLIHRVRQECPSDFLVYKPHPDVEAGLRLGKVDKQVLKQVDMVTKNITMPDCLDMVDEVHTISSLTGFEALLRDKKVVCYGLPFYAGWGLTTDMDSDFSPKKEYLTRRQRDIPLTLNQLIACSLIDYPLYHLPDGYGLAQVEQVIDYLLVEAQQPKTINAKFMLRQLKIKTMQLRYQILTFNKK